MTEKITHHLKKLADDGPFVVRWDCTCGSLGRARRSKSGEDLERKAVELHRQHTYRAKKRAAEKNV